MASSDVHIYHFQSNPAQAKYAQELHERIRRECKNPENLHTYLVALLPNYGENNEVPELRIYRFFNQPVGPHPIAMFEVNLFTPA